MYIFGQLTCSRKIFENDGNQFLFGKKKTPKNQFKFYGLQKNGSNAFDSIFVKN